LIARLIILEKGFIAMFTAIDGCLKSMEEAVRRSMRIVRNYQIFGRSGSADVKTSDSTLLTVVDSESGAAMRDFLQEWHPDIAQGIEDVGVSELDGSEYRILGDPLDGTRAFVNGLATSTVILGLYNTRQKQVVACVIGEPATGRLWSSGGGGCRLTVASEAIDVQKVVWEGALGNQTTVLLDVNHGFTRDGRQMLRDDGVARLFKRLTEYPAKILMPGSNGLHQALVANGGERLVGAITTAIGGPWDVCGARLVLDAGGAARAFRISDERALTERDPLDVLSYDLLVVGNSNETVDVLSGFLYNAVV